MAKLILDETAHALAVERLTGQPIFAGPDGALLEPGVVDLLEDGLGERWQPANKRATTLVLASEACRDLAFEAGRFPPDAAGRKRAAKSMTVPTCSLMDKVAMTLKINEHEGEAFRQSQQAWPQADQELYRQVSASFTAERLRGPVRIVRDKLGAHLDPKAINNHSIRLKIDDLLAAIGDSLVLLLLGMNVPASHFTWIRDRGRAPDGSGFMVQTMFDYPGALCWITDEEGHVKDVGTLQLAADPRNELQKHILAAARSYNEMVRAVGSSRPKLWIAPTQDLLEVERRN